ncbi:MAG TPA: RHS repeat-associated core domain-containing protein [Thermoplasmata archaeon]|nr:RHS repeat-associated core domain-containing protein [Thermoplasmata archaeon]
MARIDCGTQIPAACTTKYYLSDRLGSTRKLVDAGAPPSVVYSAEGKPYNVQGAEGYRYTGEKHDDPTGLVYLRARQYDPELGRFVGLDPVLGHLSAPQTLNRYAYVANKPLQYTDPSGLSHVPYWLERESRSGAVGFAISTYLMGVAGEAVTLGPFRMYGYSFSGFWKQPHPVLGGAAHEVPPRSERPKMVEGRPWVSRSKIRGLASSHFRRPESPSRLVEREDVRQLLETSSENL